MISTFLDFMTENFRFTLKYHERLNPKLWSKRGWLKDDVHEKLLTQADGFIAFCEIPENQVKDVVITGGNVNYNYTKFSDVDVHVLVDMKGLDSEELYDKKVAWKNEHDDVVEGYPVEMYAGDASEEHPKGQGFFSIKNSRWVEYPNHMDRVDALEDRFVIEKIQHAIHFIRFLVSKGTLDEIEDYKHKLFQARSSGLHDGGEFSPENVMYKELRNRGWIDKLNAKYHSLK